MTTTTFKNLYEKVSILAALLGATEHEFGEQFNGNHDNYFIAFEGASNPRHNVRHEFESTRAMHTYLNDKIRLFKS